MCCQQAAFWALSLHGAASSPSENSIVSWPPTRNRNTAVFSVTALCSHTSCSGLVPKSQQPFAGPFSWLVSHIIQAQVPNPHQGGGSLEKVTSSKIHLSEPFQVLFYLPYFAWVCTAVHFLPLESKLSAQGWRVALYQDIHYPAVSNLGHKCLFLICTSISYLPRPQHLISK